MARIVLSTFGSLGDLHPYLAMGRALREAGHEAVVATHAHYEVKVRAEGLAFHRLRPGEAEIGPESRWAERAMDLRDGSEYVFRELVLPWLRESFEDLRSASRGADLVVGHMLVFVAPLVAESMGLPWLGVTLQPMTLLSATDPAVYPQAPWLTALRPLGTGPFRLVRAVALAGTRPWFEPVADLRRSLGLPACRLHPMIATQDSPWGTLGLFSRHFAAPQPDWPGEVAITGFPWFRSGCERLSLATQAFLTGGEAPLVFTLGTAAVNDPGDFYDVAKSVTKRLRRRAILLVGKQAFVSSAARLAGSGIHVADYEPFCELFPRAALVVHQAGVGTTAEALRAGVPQICVPYSHDQPDSASRVVRMGLGKVVSRNTFSESKVFCAAISLLESDDVRARAREMARRIGGEDFRPAFLALVERALAGSPQGTSEVRTSS